MQKVTGEIMEVYKSFARVYDAFMDDTPYEEWSRYLIHLLKKSGVYDGLVLELGCGTGSMTEILSSVGYDMIGVDLSAEMLEIATRKKEETGSDILYLQQDMRTFELYGTVRAVVSICDSMNYITSPEDLLKVFRKVNNYLDPGGYFIFDLNTKYKYEILLGSKTFAENRDMGSYIWENFYEEESGLNEYALTLFIKDAENRYDKYEEIHYQRAYAPEEIIQLLTEAGLHYIGMYHAFTDHMPEAKSERIYVIAKECRKEERK